jgi:hypothetical protein
MIYKKTEVTEHWTMTAEQVAQFLGTAIGENDSLFLTLHGTAMVELSIVRTAVSTEWDVDERTPI